MRNPDNVGLYPAASDGTSRWTSAVWNESSDTTDLYLNVEHNHEFQAKEGKRTKKELHLMLTQDELLNLYGELHGLIVQRLKERGELESDKRRRLDQPKA